MMTTMQASLQAAAVPAHLRCEYEVDPVGVGRTPPVLMWEVRAAEPAERGAGQTAYRILVASSPDILSKDEGDLWDSGKLASSETLGIRYEGAPLAGLQQVWWKVKLWDGAGHESAWSEPGHWTMALDPGAWQAKWITRDWTGPDWTSAKGEQMQFIQRLLPAPFFRKEFTATKPVRQALLSVTAAGCYEAHLNGARVGDLALEPGWTFSRKHYDREPGWLAVRTLDVTERLREGANAIGFILGDGWHRDRHGFGKDNRRDRSNGEPSGLLAQLDIEYADGSRETVATGEDWQLWIDGPIRDSSIFDGTRYDVRKEMPGWSEPGFDAAGWIPALVTERFAALALVPQVRGPVTVMAEVAPVAITERKPGLFVADFGQQLAGVCRITLDGAAGTRVVVRHAQALQPDGLIYTANLGASAVNSDEYTLDGKGPRTFEPPFTYRGFQYAQIEGLPSREALRGITALLLADRARRIGRFTSSDDRLNRLWKACYWTTASNAKSVFVDCTGRAERRGWMWDGIGTLAAQGLQFEFANLTDKALRDIRFEQLPGGMFDYVAPWGGMPSNLDPDGKRIVTYPAGWVDSGVTGPFNLLMLYGDDRSLAEHWDAMWRFSKLMEAKFPDHIAAEKHGHFWADWLSFSMTKARPRGPREPVASHPGREVFATAWWYWTTCRLEALARHLGKSDEAAQLAALAGKIRAAFNERFVDAATGAVGMGASPAACDSRGFANEPEEGKAAVVGGQTDAAMALDMGLIDNALKPKVLRFLLDRIAAYNDHLSTGIHGTFRALHALSDHGEHATAYRLAMQPSFPSFGYMIDQGATGIWESWEHISPDENPEEYRRADPNHPGLGMVGEWIFTRIGGIRPDPAHPGFKRFFLQPRMDAGPEWVKAELDSVRGAIRCHWKREGETCTVAVTVPPNTTAEVWLPVNDPVKVKESGQALGSAAGATPLATKSEGIRLECGSGNYAFTFATTTK